MMTGRADMDTAVAQLSFENRENEKRHHHHDEDMLQYEYMKAGDMRAVEESQRMITSELTGHVSDDPVQNMRYLFVACATLMSRTAIEGGMDPEQSYNASDLFIIRMDRCRSVEEILQVHKEMVGWYTRHMAGMKKALIYSRQIVRCLDYIGEHLHETIRITDIADHLHLNVSYVSSLFRKETGLTISDYILQQRIESAQHMLKHTEYSGAEISQFLSFSSQSYFIRAFRASTGMTPAQYRRRFYRRGFEEEAKE